MLASLLWAVGPVHFDEAKVPKQVHMWYDKPNGFFTTTDYFNTCAGGGGRGNEDFGCVFYKRKFVRLAAQTPAGRR